LSRWGEADTETVDEAKRFWAEAPLATLLGMMEPRWAWEEWLRIAAGVITEPGSVFEPGCGIGLLTEVLPPGCTYYGCDLNAGYVSEARSRHPQPEFSFEVKDMDDVLDSGEKFEWVIVTSLFGMFPEEATYEMIPRFWGAARHGLSLTSVDKRIFGRIRMPQGKLTAHDPEELVAAARSLEGVGTLRLRRGREFPKLRGDFRQGAIAIHVWRDRAGAAP
jgi:SAM-dependent methyltransferase